MIPEKYYKIIRQCESRIGELNEKSKKFVLGDPESKFPGGKDPLRNRPFLSIGQKTWLDKIVVEQLEGGKWDKSTIQVTHGDVSANRTREGWVVNIGGHSIGTGIARKEVPAVTAWLHTALHDLLQVPDEAFANYIKATAAEDIDQIAEESFAGPTQTQDEPDPF